jgi:hypothetical protein
LASIHTTYNLSSAVFKGLEPSLDLTSGRIKSNPVELPITYFYWLISKN